MNWYSVCASNNTHSTLCVRMEEILHTVRRQQSTDQSNERKRRDEVEKMQEQKRHTEKQRWTKQKSRKKCILLRLRMKKLTFSTHIFYYKHKGKQSTHCVSSVCRAKYVLFFSWFFSHFRQFFSGSPRHQKDIHKYICKSTTHTQAFTGCMNILFAELCMQCIVVFCSHLLLSDCRFFVLLLFHLNFFVHAFSLCLK